MSTQITPENRRALVEQIATCIELDGVEDTRRAINRAYFLGACTPPLMASMAGPLRQYRNAVSSDAGELIEEARELEA